MAFIWRERKKLSLALWECQWYYLFCQVDPLLFTPVKLNKHTCSTHHLVRGLHLVKGNLWDIFSLFQLPTRRAGAEVFIKWHLIHSTLSLLLGLKLLLPLLLLLQRNLGNVMCMQVNWPSSVFIVFELYYTHTQQPSIWIASVAVFSSISFFIIFLLFLSYWEMCLTQAMSMSMCPLTTQVVFIWSHEMLSAIPLVTAIIQSLFLQFPLSLYFQPNKWLFHFQRILHLHLFPLSVCVSLQAAFDFGWSPLPMTNVLIVVLVWVSLLSLDLELLYVLLFSPFPWATFGQIKWTEVALCLCIRSVHLRRWQWRRWWWFTRHFVFCHASTILDTLHVNAFSSGRRVKMGY